MGGHTRLRKREWGEPIRTKGRTIWYSSYSIISLRTEWSFRLGEDGVINPWGVGCLRKWLLEFRESRNLNKNCFNFAKFRVIFHKIRLSLTEWRHLTATCGYINCKVKFQKLFRKVCALFMNKKYLKSNFYGKSNWKWIRLNVEEGL